MALRGNAVRRLGDTGGNRSARPLPITGWAAANRASPIVSRLPYAGKVARQSGYRPSASAAKPDPDGRRIVAATRLRETVASPPRTRAQALSSPQPETGRATWAACWWAGSERAASGWLADRLQARALRQQFANGSRQAANCGVSTSGSVDDPTQDPRPSVHHRASWRDALRRRPPSPRPVGRRLRGACPSSLRAGEARRRSTPARDRVGGARGRAVWSG